MADDDQSDPFLWDEDRVVRELCTPHRTWKAPPEKRLPDPALLEAKLRDCSVDGESLLTYEDGFGFKELWDYLGVKKLPHQLSLKDAISQLRRRSQKYAEWKTQQLADSQAYGQEEDALVIKSESTKLAHLDHAAQVSPPPASITANAADQIALSSTLSPPADLDLPALPEPAKDLGPEQEATEGPPSKKRRVAPTAISNAPTGNRAYGVIPTQGDRFIQRTAETVLQAEDSGFLGTGILRLDQVLDSRDVEVEDPAQDEFGWVQCNIPLGRRLQVSARIKRFLRSARVDTFNPNPNWEDDSTGSYDGEYDRESVDSDTWREYQQEEEERLAKKARGEAAKDRQLTKEQITDAVRNAIQELEARWAAEKKPKQDLRAWRTWQDARRNPDRLALIISVKRQSGLLNDRIELFSRDIIRQSWLVNENVQRTVSDILEASVFEKKRQDWLIDVLESPRQPPKPATLPRLTPKRVKPSILDDDEEELTSDSDGDLKAFIEYDDSAAPLVNDEMDVDSEQSLARATVPANPSRDGSALAPDEADPGDPFVGGLSSDAQADMHPAAQHTPSKVKVEQLGVPTTPRRTGAPTSEVVELDLTPTPFKKLDRVPGLDDLESLEKIGEIGVEHWEKERDAERLLVAVLCEWPRGKIVKILATIKSHDHTEVWAKYISPTIEDPSSATADSVAFLLCRLFDIFVSKSATRALAPNLRTITCQRLYREGHLFGDFCAYLGRILPLFLGAVPQTPSRTKPSREEQLSTQGSVEIRDPADDGSSSEGPSSDEMTVPSTKKRRQRKRRDKVAEKIRIDTFKTNEEQSQRARQLREKMAELAEQGSVSSKKSRLIVNESKESEDQGLIYINEHIGSKIKDHQVEGVRFMWNQVVAHSSVRQGCLLAHTMGLGKTMQVITLLVVIAESSASDDASVKSQIPESLRESKTLILCPASLVDNWYEEIRLWEPYNTLGPIYRMYAALSSSERPRTIQAWAQDGGVLIIGYTMFASLVRDDVGDVAKLLLEAPNLVIGDEAHYLKNPESQRHQAAANFKTMSRIAMTGSPLTNNVMDYYSMINWVAPGYLADIAEFRQRFSNPINEGLYVDSEPQQKRKARKMLQVLKATVDPKVHRRDIEVLFNELPRKKEFIITLPLTKHQWRLYQTYIELVTDPSRELITGAARAWSLVAKLGLVLAHPFIFKTVAEAQKAKRKGIKSKASISTNGQKPEENSEEEMPQDVLHDLLAAVAVREIEDYALSNKILVLLRILDECRKVKDKVLVFSQSIPTLDYIENICKRRRVVYQRLDGQTPMATRQEAINKFNTDSSSEVYLVSTTAGGVGLNIYGANRVVIFDFKYTPADEQQAIGRAYRLGQTKPVYVYWLTIGGTFEDTIHNNAVFKTQLASRVVDKKNPDPWSKRFAEYFAMPREVDQDDISGAEGQDRVLDALLDSGDIRKHIRKITSTETFEKEETYELTAEEKKEVEDDVKLELLRSRDPEKFKSLERDRALQQRTVRIPVPASYYQPRPADALVSPRDPFALRPTSFTAAVAQSLFPGGNPVPGQQATAQHVLPSTQNALSNGALGNSTLTQIPKQAVPAPILATGTQFKVPQPRPPQEPPNGPSDLSNPNTPLLIAAETMDFGLPELLEVHNTLCSEGRHVRHHPNELINRVKDVLTRNKIERLPMMDKLQNMKKFARNPRFAEAMLSGYLEPEQIASLTRLEMEKIAASLSGMAEGEFKQRVWTTKANLSLFRTQLSPKVKTEKRQAGGSGEVKDRGNRGVLRFIGSGPDSQDSQDSPATPQDRRLAAVKPGDSAESPHIID